jgi:hypothetical protein
MDNPTLGVHISIQEDDSHCLKRKKIKSTTGDTNRFKKT